MRQKQLLIAATNCMLVLSGLAWGVEPAMAQQSAVKGAKTKSSKPVWHSTIKEQGAGKATAKPKGGTSPRAVTGGAFLNFMVGGYEGKPAVDAGKETGAAGSLPKKP
jgi:hypothetical protein